MSDRRYLTRADIDAAEDLPIEEVEVREWGGWVGVRALSGTERSQYQAGLIEFLPSEGDNPVTQRHRLSLVNVDVRLAALSMVHPETRERLYTAEEVEVLGQKSAAALNRVVEVAQRLSALTPKDLEELTEGLEGTPNADSTSS